MAIQTRAFAVRCRLAHVVVAALAAVAVSACTASGGSQPARDSASPVANSSSRSAVPAGRAPTEADPQVFSDVVAGAFPIPGPSQLRTLRVGRGAISAVNVACGGSADPHVGATDLRVDQARWADLQLIAKKGLTEPPVERVGMVDIAKCPAPIAVAAKKWHGLNQPWRDATLTATQSAGVTATLGSVGACLTAGAHFDIHLDASDPTASFLDQVDRYMSGMGQDVSSAKRHASEMHRLSALYVACTPPYFAAMEKALTPQRNQLVKRNRELLTEFARDLSAAGYVP